MATASAADAHYVRGLGAHTVIDYTTTRFEDAVSSVHAMLDTVGGETRQRSFRVVKDGGIVVSVVSKPPPGESPSRTVRSVFFLVEVTTERLDTLTDLFARGELRTNVGTVFPLDHVRQAHEMLGERHKDGKIVLSVADLG